MMGRGGVLWREPHGSKISGKGSVGKHWVSGDHCYPGQPGETWLHPPAWPETAIPGRDPARALGAIAPQALVESRCLHNLVKLPLNPPVPPLLDFVVVVTAIPYFERSVERSATKNTAAPMTVGEKRYYWIVLILDIFKEDREKW